MSEVIATITNSAYRRQYKMRLADKRKTTVESSIPFDVIERHAREAGLSIEEFLDKYRIEWLYDDFKGAFARFVRK